MTRVFSDTIFNYDLSSWNVMLNSTKLFNGLAYQNILGKHYITIPYKQSNGRTACGLLQINELQGFRVIEAKHDNRVCMIVGYKNKKYSTRHSNI